MPATARLPSIMESSRTLAVAITAQRETPVITFAALARLHFRHGWPKEFLGSQPRGGAFDLVGFRRSDDQQPFLLGEVKKSSRELASLREDLLALADGASHEDRPRNSINKWNALLKTRPALLWLVGPAEEEYVYVPAYTGTSVQLRLSPAAALDYPVAQR